MPRTTSAGRTMLRFVALAAVAGTSFFIAAGLTGGARLAEPLPSQLDRFLVSGGFGIQEISVTGHRYTTDQDIYAALALDQAGSLLRYDVTAARERIESLAWIDTASVVRVLPNRLAVTVTERRPAAVWHHNGRTALVDATGRVLAYLAGSNLPPLPRVSGAGAPAAIGGLLAALEPHSQLMARLAVAHRLAERRWTLELASGHRIHLPVGGEGEALLRLARANAAGQLIGEKPHVIDLRQPGVIALSGETPAAPQARAIGTASAW